MSAALHLRAEGDASLAKQILDDRDVKRSIERFEKDVLRQARGKLKDVVKAEKNKFLRKDRNKPFEKKWLISEEEFFSSDADPN